MSRKTMLLAAGVFSALVLAALPAIASAVETEVHCPKAPCIGTIKGLASEHAIIFENDNGEKLEAAEVVGTIQLAAATGTTATIELTFKGVKEKISGFNFSCNSPGAAAGEIKTGVLTTHFINLTTGGTNPAVLLTGLNATDTCAAFLTKTTTGSLIGTITTPNCNVAASTNVFTFNIKAPSPKGTQEHELWTGKSFDLTSGTQSSDGTTTALTARLNITWQAENKPTLTC